MTSSFSLVHLAALPRQTIAPAMLWSKKSWLSHICWLCIFFSIPIISWMTINSCGNINQFLTMGTNSNVCRLAPRNVLVFFPQCLLVQSGKMLLNVRCVSADFADIHLNWENMFVHIYRSCELYPLILLIKSWCLWIKRHVSCFYPSTVEETITIKSLLEHTVRWF